MPLDRSTNSQENGNPGRIKLVLRLDSKGKSPDSKLAPVATSPPASTEARPKRSPHPTKHSDEAFYHGQKIPKKQNLVPEEQANKEKEIPPEDPRPSRKRKSTMDSDFVFDPIYSKKNGLDDDDEEDEEEIVESNRKGSGKKRGLRSGRDDDWGAVSPPPQHEVLKLKLKLPKPPLPDTPDNKNKKVEPGSSEAKKRRKNEEEDLELETPPRLKVTLKKNTPVDTKKETTPPQSKKAKPEVVPGGSVKKHSPIKKEEPIIEKRELREKPKPNLTPKTPATEEDVGKLKKHLGNVLAQLIKLDKQQYFMDPVTEDIAPQYFSIISHPMDFKTMKKKLKDGKYDSVESLQDDFQLICNNCMTYNPASTSYAREAKRMLNMGNRVFEKSLDVTAGTTTEHKLDDIKKKEMEKTPTRLQTPSSTPTKATPNKPTSTPNSTVSHHPLTRSATAPSTPTTPLSNNSLGVAFPISSGQLSSMQHPISTTPQHAPYPLTPTGLRKPIGGVPPAYPPPPHNPNSAYSPRIGHIPPAVPSTISRPPMLPLQKSQSTNSMMPRPPLTPVPSVPTPARPTPPVGKPGARPPVVSMAENQATQTQAMFPEQPKRRYVKLPVEEPAKPPPPAVQDKTPGKLVAKIGTTPLVSPANVAGSFVYSMYIPRLESTPQKPTETTSPNFTNTNYINNYLSVPSLHIPLPPPDSSLSSDDWRCPSHKISENEEVMEAIASDSFASMDADSRSQLMQFFEGIAAKGLQSSDGSSNLLSFPSFATSALLPKAALPVSLLQPIKATHQTVLAPTPTPPPSASATPIHATTITTVVSTSPSSPTLPTPPSFLIMDTELSDQLAKLESHEINEHDLKQLQEFQIDLSFLSSLQSSSSTSPASVSSPTSTTTTTTSVSSPSLPEPMEITPLPASQIVTPPVSPPIFPPVSNTGRTTVVVQPEPAKAKKLAQEILDKNLEYLWALQLMQHERVSTNASEAELKLASQFLDGVFALGTAVPPSMLTTKEAVRAAMEASGLITGKRRHMRI